ncbi:phage tail protein [Ferirhizobium litorale]|uniref:Phage tail protein n=1 Tax=Ferirhizobium litorale TaxID=2927786 RepID=A0AAE3QGC7_9HYPH|nr:phage tail protein [Fererhizobium litorale]MDI7923408.1 phage tail protein [Fererhizobium litorale]
MAEKTDDLIISISTDLATVRRSLKRLESDIASTSGNVQKQFDTLGKGIDKSMSTALQARITEMVGVGKAAAKEWNGVLSDQGKELDRLRAKYSPLYAAVSNYRSSIASIKQAYAVGALSSNEYAAAMSRERQAALASIAAIKGRNAALADAPNVRGGAGAFNTSNLAAQGFDVAATAGSMPWYTVALQQGPQVAQVFNDIRASGQRIGPAVAGAFLQLVNPISLVTIGVIGATAAAASYFSGVVAGGDKSAKVLKEQAELVRQVVTEWGSAVPALQKYSEELERAKKASDLKAGAEIVNANTLEGTRAAIEAARLEFDELTNKLRSAGEDDEIILRLQAAFQEFTQAANDGSLEVENVERVQNALAAAINSTGLPAATDFRDMLEKMAASALLAAGNVQKLNAQTGAATTALFPSQGAYPNVERSANGRIQGDTLPEYGPLPESRPSTEGMYENGSWTKPSSGRKRGDDLAREIEQIKERTSVLQSMTAVQAGINPLIDDYGFAVEKARARQELLNAAQSAGKTVTPELAAQIETLSTAYATATVEAEKLGESQDKIRQRAEDMRNFQQDLTRGIVDGFLEGKKAADVFADALGAIGDKLLDLAFDSAFDSKTGFLSNILGGLFGGATGGKDPWAGLRIPGRATGGPVSAGQPYIVGEKRPELFVPRTSGTIIPRIPEIGAKGGAGGVNVSFAPVYNVQGSGPELDKLREQMARDRAEFEGRVQKIVRNRPNRGW